jgi:hypothetical protein
MGGMAVFLHKLLTLVPDECDHLDVPAALVQRFLYSLERRLIGPQKQSGCCSKEKISLTLLGIEPQYVGHPAYTQCCTD